MTDGRLPTFLQGYWDWKYAALLTALLTVTVVLPVLGVDSREVPLFQLTFVSVLLAGVLATARHRIILVTAAVLATAGEFGAFLPKSGRAACLVLFFFLVSVVVLADVMKAGRVDTDRILGAVCGFLLIAVCFAVVFALVEAMNPGSFNVEEPTFVDLLYFSQVTLSTLGYGDIIPLSRPSRALASFEAVIGQFYIAVVVARLVSLQVTTPPRD